MNSRNRYTDFATKWTAALFSIIVYWLQEKKSEMTSTQEIIAGITY
ncbi:hypothetical protein ANACAC_02996 [Anaerostipes caccae L1-92]|uniref:Uncharacterized protein n=1 Tax=Anaerostipes caccae (strain DSM 14662 / CCUG 47493 / JCM 13470 / NCIMB 13811 / L1-92) TaxID=411490 RepID=B0MHN4_ANACD|nr:hypothetical protein ANACAC_02996 [Anaerostipes caccae L1-92]